MYYNTNVDAARQHIITEEMAVGEIIVDGGGRGLPVSHWLPAGDW